MHAIADHVKHVIANLINHLIANHVKSFLKVYQLEKVSVLVFYLWS